ncbi:MAG: carboxypeptidase-like regulatory domain-containing protein [Bacteroidia bacterium]
MKLLKHTLLICCCFTALIAGGQTKKTNTKPVSKVKVHNLIQFSGVVVDNDSLRPVSNTSIFAKNKYHGTVSDFFGYFSFVAETGDTIEFAALSYRTAQFVIPDSLTSNKYSLIQLMRHDTFTLKQVVINAWPTKAQFVKTFIEAPLPGDDMSRARKNLDPGAMAARAATIANDGYGNYRAGLEQRYSRLYYAGQLPPNNLLNPISWYKFVEAWKRGDFKKSGQTPSPDTGAGDQ